MATLSLSHLLDTWDAGAGRHPMDRALLMLALAGHAPAEALADVPLGQRNWALMRLRRQRFGDHLSVWLDCDACGERMALELAADDLPAPSDTGAEIEVEGRRFRRPTTRDLAALADEADAASAARRLFRACAVDAEALPDDPLDAMLVAVEQALDEADPWADLTLVADCPACGRRHEAALDVPGLLWDEIEAAAHGLLDDVHALASAYGWSERDVLSLSPARRAAYMARIAP